MILADVHNHTLISHGEASAAQMHKAARRLGLAWYGFSEHSPLPPGYACPLYHGDLAGDFPGYVEEVLALRAHSPLPGAPRVLLGMELDWIPSRMPYMRELAARWPFDYVIGGLHFLDMLAVGSPKNWGQGESEEERCRRFAAYYREMTAMVRSGLMNIVAHPDFIKVRCWGSFQAWLAAPGSLDLIRETLTAMRETGVALEVSSAGLRKDFAEPYPAPPVMRLAAELGVNISFGSDAHATADVAFGFDQLAAYARSFGYAQSVIFVGRKPRFLPF